MKVRKGKCSSFVWTGNQLPQFCEGTGYLIQRNVRLNQCAGCGHSPLDVSAYSCPRCGRTEGAYRRLHAYGNRKVVCTTCMGSTEVLLVQEYSMGAFGGSWISRFFPATIPNLRQYEQYIDGSESRETSTNTKPSSSQKQTVAQPKQSKSKSSPVKPKEVQPQREDTVVQRVTYAINNPNSPRKGKLIRYRYKKDKEVKLAPKTLLGRITSGSPKSHKVFIEKDTIKGRTYTDQWLNAGSIPVLSKYIERIQLKRERNRRTERSKSAPTPTSIQSPRPSGVREPSSAVKDLHQRIATNFNQEWLLVLRSQDLQNQHGLWDTAKIASVTRRMEQTDHWINERLVQEWIEVYYDRVSLVVFPSLKRKKEIEKIYKSLRRTPQFANDMPGFTTQSLDGRPLSL